MTKVRGPSSGGAPAGGGSGVRAKARFLPQSQVSRQLAVLRGAGLVTGEKRGRWVYYRIASELPPFHRRVLESVALELQSDAAREDRERFAGRLRLREGGVCSVGYPLETPYREVIPVQER